MSKIENFLNNRKQYSEILNDPTYKILFDKNKFQEPKVHSFNHNGMKIDTIFESAYEEDSQGYICHRLNLVHDKKYIGYLKVFYIPQDVFYKMNPDILHFSNNIEGGCCGLKTHPKEVDLGGNNYWKNLNQEEKEKTLSRLAMSINYALYTEIEKNPDNLSLEKRYQKILKIANNSNIKEKYDDFVNTHINKPIIEFSNIRTSNKKNCQKNFSNTVKEYCIKNNIDFENFGAEDNSIDYQRQGLGQKMYTLMADWLALNGLKLYKGGTNDKSTPLWEKSMKENPDINVIEDENGKFFIDHTQNDLSYLLDNKNNKKIKNKPF